MEQPAVNSIWNEYFLDVNVRFPKQPTLVNGISIYDAPYGLGVQFRGGPNKLVIRGKNSNAIFTFLKPILNGRYSLNNILEESAKEFNINDVAAVLKILHANSLLIDSNQLAQDIEEPSINYSTSQVNFYDRVIGKTGFNKNGREILDIISDCKVLLILSENVILPTLNFMRIGGFKNLGIYGESNDINILEKADNIFHNKLMIKENISNNTDEVLLNNIYNNVDNFQYVIVGLENPSNIFLTKINSICLIKNIPVLFLTKRLNSYEIGPYVVPYRTSCYTCSTLRRNSYYEDSVYENVYQDGLVDSQKIMDDNVKGNDGLSTYVAVSYMVSEFIKIVSGYAYPILINQLIEYDLLNGQFNNQSIIRVPGCPDCSK